MWEKNLILFTSIWVLIAKKTFILNRNDKDVTTVIITASSIVLENQENQENRLEAILKLYFWLSIHSNY